MTAVGPVGPGRDCPLCPRLAAMRARNRAAWPAWHNAPVPSFGPLTARLLVVGLAPGVKGANRTGRPFTGDHAGELLYGALLAHGFAAGTYRADPSDGVTPLDVRITNAARCVPPENRPTPAEIRTCNPFLAAELGAMPALRVILALGSVAHGAVLAAWGARPSAHPFAHGAAHPGPGGLVLLDSYHCSRLNTSTGRLTTAMFHEIVAAAAHRIRSGA